MSTNPALALAAAPALAVGPDRFTVADLAATVRSSTGQDGNDYTVRPSGRAVRSAL